MVDQDQDDDATAIFLEAFLHGVPDTLHFYLWSLPTRTSLWYPTTDAGAEAAITHVRQRRDKKDFYIGCGLSLEARKTNQRTHAGDAAGIVGLWADVDYGEADGIIHKKPNLPPTQDDATGLMLAVHPRPSILVHSGHGLQGWWLLDEPWIFADEEQRALAADLEHRWNQRLQQAAKEGHDWGVDSVHDLSRVLRLPGSVNHKVAEDPKPVLLLDVSGMRYDRKTLAKHAGAPEATKARIVTAGNRDQYVQDVGPFELRVDATPPFHKWEILKEADNRMSRAWARKRRDLADQSPSGYDLAMASVAMTAGWTDQEIVDLLIAARVHNSEAPKVDRPDYYARTLMKARESSARASASEDLEQAVDELERAPSPERQGEVRETVLDHISASLGVRFTRIIRFTQDPPKYKLVTPSGSTIMGASTLLAQNQFRAKMAEATSIVTPRFKAPQWDKLAQSILKAAEDVDTGEEATEMGAVRTWMADYLLDHPPAAVKDESVVQMQLPYREAGVTYVFGAAFRRWLALVRGEKVSAQQMGVMLRTFGAEPVTIMVTVEDRRTSRAVWRMPE